MTGNTDQYNPTVMFKEWIQKNGKAQREFMNMFAGFMDDNSKPDFNPLDTLKRMAEKTQEAQNLFLENMHAMQSKTMNNAMNFGINLSNIMYNSTFKTTIGSNGRISIPEAERSALGLTDGDLVQVILMPIKKQKRE